MDIKREARNEDGVCVCMYVCVCEQCTALRYRIEYLACWTVRSSSRENIMRYSELHYVLVNNEWL